MDPAAETVGFAALGAANIGAWLWALGEARSAPGVLGMAIVAYGFGLRHAFDADHIAAIDNVTRNLARQGVAPVSVGLWFSLGHSTIVTLACAGAALALGALQQWTPGIRAVGGVAGTLISAAFLFAIAGTNANVLRRLMRARAEKSSVTATVSPRGPVAAALGNLLAQIRRPPAMFAVGMLFGISFDTASEIGLIGISTGEAARAASPRLIMLFPVLFAAAMALADTFDGLVMARTDGLAFGAPRRRLNCDLTVTALTTAAAVTIGVVELAAIVAGWLKLKGGLWSFAKGIEPMHFGDGRQFVKTQDLRRYRVCARIAAS